MSYNDVISAFLVFGFGCLVAVAHSVIERFCTEFVLRDNNGIIEQNRKIHHGLLRLRALDMKTNVVLERLAQDLKKPIPGFSMKEDSKIKPLILDISKTNAKVFNLLEQKISCTE